MKYTIKHEIKGRIRLHLNRKQLSFEEADMLLYYVQQLNGVLQAKVYERTADVAVVFSGNRKELLRALSCFCFPVKGESAAICSSSEEKKNIEISGNSSENSGRKLNSVYQEKLVSKVLIRIGKKILLPAPVRYAWTAAKSLRYLKKGLQCLKNRKLEVPVLDAAAIGVSVIRSDFDTAGSVMFLLEIGEMLEEWTHKKSAGDLARSMALNTGKVWLKSGGMEIETDASKVVPGDLVIVRVGCQIPFDGIVAEGEAMVNQASMTGESLPVKKSEGTTVYAGTVVEEGEITIKVSAVSGFTRYEKIVKMIESSEKLKSGMESRAEHLADCLVPYTFLGTAAAWLLTRNATRTLSVLMVDFSCALKMAMPITVLSAIRDANQHHVTVKGGKFLESFAKADTIVFDKTGTLTKAQPYVREVIPFSEFSRDELLRIAACLEEHFPHSIANAVVRAAKEKNLSHEEMHTKVEYIVAHGIASTINGRRVIIGSYHFVFEDEKCEIREEYRTAFEMLPSECSHLFLAIDHRLAAVICIDDPLREDAPDAVRGLHECGFSKIVMMTGDSERTARTIASDVGVDEYYSEVLPEDKAAFVEKERSSGRTVVMVGDGINDSPALSAADVGIAISDGAAIAREISDITISGENLNRIIGIRKLSEAMIHRINRNYRMILGINGSLIALGVTGLIPPATSALLHNISTVAIGVNSMKSYPEEM